MPGSPTPSKDFLDTAPKRELVRCIRDLHRLRKSAAPGNSVLMGTRNSDLVASIRKQCGRDYELDAGGRAVARGGATDPAVASRSGRRRPSRGAVGGPPPPPQRTPPRGAARRVDRAAVIRLLTDTNLKREGTAAHARFSKLQDGMTVADYCAAAGKIASGTLLEAIRRGHVELDPAPAKSD